MRSTLHLMILVPLLLVVADCTASQVSGTYVAHTSAFTEMLQLTATPDGQISGVLSYVGLKSNGQISSEQTPVNGSVDAGQLTLKFPTILSFISGKSLAGTVSKNTICLQIMDANGNVSSEAFERSSPSQFKAYADEMRSKGQAITYNTKLLNLAQQYRETVGNAENWMANAKAHAARISAAKNDYDKIERQMQSLVRGERASQDSVTRSQISVAVSQANIVGEQVDIQVQQVWDLGIGDSGTKLENEFVRWDGDCGTDNELRKQGATDRAVEVWDKACKDVVAERAKFEVVYKKISEQRADLRQFQITAEAHRKALVNEANQIQ